MDSADAIVRAARRFGDLSQRDLATASKVALSTVTRIESGKLDPTLTTLATLLAAAGCRLVVVRSDGKRLRHLDDGGLTDAQGRRYPAHLDIMLPSVWRYGTRRPPGVVRAVVRYHLDRGHRDRERQRGRVDPRMMPSPWD